MGVMHTIWEDLLEDTSFALFGIYANLEDYTLAYHLNKGCGLKLSRARQDLEFANEVAFPYFQWKDQSNFVEWTLLGNKANQQEDRPSQGLFPEQPTTRWPYLIPEQKGVDYFLKIDGIFKDPLFLRRLRDLPNIITAYDLDPAELKSKHNLIF